MTIFEVVGESAYVETDEGLRVLYVWRGGHVVNVFSQWGERDLWRNTDAFTVGDHARDVASLCEVKSGIAEYREALRSELQDTWGG